MSIWPVTYQHALPGNDLLKAESVVLLRLRWERCAALQQLASHGLFNVMVQAEGDTWIDDHHTNEDIGAPIALACSYAACLRPSATSCALLRSSLLC